MTNHQPFASGQKALVIGCGLGDDAEALAHLGFEVTTFDISPTAMSDDKLLRIYACVKSDFQIRLSTM
ncbi:hypothetical protein [Nostoc sp. DedQUE09]|uniref:hypothetical protein n=1 Tax=Nostoc sp. DedQUE09 TaxID=3075394 RepID=UPI002AD3F65E|nr:hypothetical protein [Nostoc sp. DedQUE09]MDZ7952448.1 hypothetical protein [Nostoc sp. DedQUE09]